MYVIAGLGNPGAKYENTRHNIGFMVIDAIAGKNHISVTEKKHKALIGKGIVGGERTLLVSLSSYRTTSVWRRERCASGKREAPEDITG